MKTSLTALTFCLASCAAFAAPGEPTEAQIDAAFKKADPDQDGTVSRAEARRFGITKEAFDQSDPDKDGTLTRKEFLAAVAYQFNKANPDKDSTLDRKEAGQAGVKGKKSFDAANPDKDQTLDLSEYLQALTLKAK